MRSSHAYLPVTAGQFSMSRNLILAFDTASETIALAVANDEGASFKLIDHHDEAAPRRANVCLLPRIDALFRKNGLSAEDIGCVVCGRGPGSFTGVRIGVATAKGLASGLRVPLYGVSTLDAVAWGVWKSGFRGLLGVVADAMRGEVYPVLFRVTDTAPERLECDTVAKAESAARRWAQAVDEPLALAGDGIHKYRTVFEKEFETSCRLTFCEDSLWVPTGESLLYAFERERARKECATGDPGALLPVYTRLSDAEENERIRLGTTGQVIQGALVNAAVPASGVVCDGDGAQETHPQNDLTLRPLSLHDLNHIVTIEREVFRDEAWTLGMFEDELLRTDRTWWVACKGSQIVGYCGGWVVDGELQILDVAVISEFRRCGIAQELIRRVVHDGADLGARSVTLEVRADNASARKLYEKLRFEVEGIRPNYYPAVGGLKGEGIFREDGTPARREDAVIMRGPVEPTETTGVLDASGLGTLAGMELKDNACRVDAGMVKERSVQAYPMQGQSPPGQPKREGRTGEGKNRPLILAIESSCDETAAAIIDGRGTLLADVIASQVDFHARFGGVVPEIASRKHTEAIVGVVDETLIRGGRELGVSSLEWGDLDALAVTFAPGLVGALVVGLAFAKGVSWATGLPLVGVNHLEGHIYANKFASSVSSDDAAAEPIEPPLVVALLSGGHTMLVHVKDWGDYEILGQTLDDAVGEAFDKVAKALGLGYPGGPVISKLAEQGRSDAIDFPRAMMHSGDFRFSLSGLKTAVITYIKRENEAGRTINTADLAASFQQAVIDVQVAKAVQAVEQTGVHTFCLGGGVAANPALRVAYCKAMDERGTRVVLPPLSACTDNAGMIAAVALDRLAQGKVLSLDADAYSHLPIDQEY